MISPTGFRDLVSGRSSGPLAAAARGLLRVAEIPYTAAVNQRNRRFDAARTTIHHVSVPVVSVGNLTLGGTGKTPLVRWIAHWLHRQDLRVAIVSRGYGAADGGVNDEALELKQSLPDVPHVQHADRVAAAQCAIDKFGSQAIVLDDGFQHRRLAREFDIVVIDAREPFGFGHVFPRGTLREPVSAARRADLLVLSHADMVTADERQRLREQLNELAPHAGWCETQHAPQQLVDTQGGNTRLDELRDSRVAAFAGIGNPQGFQHLLQQLGCQIVDWREFPDHHCYRREHIQALHNWVRDLQVDQVVCTQKDLVKVRRVTLADKPLRAVQVDIQFLFGEQAMIDVLCRFRSQCQH